MGRAGMRTHGRVGTGRLAAVGIGFLFSILMPPVPAGASTPVTTEYRACGVSQEYVVPAETRFLTITAVGAGGRDGADGADGVSLTSSSAPGGSGGRGAAIWGTLAVSPGQVFTVDVGCSSSESLLNPEGGAGGEGTPLAVGDGGRGGGASVISSGSTSYVIAGGGGGGAGGVSYTGGFIAGAAGGDAGRPTGTSGDTGGESDGGCVSGGEGGGGASQTSGGSGGARGFDKGICPPPNQLGTDGASGSFRQGGDGGRGGEPVDWCGGSGAGGGGAGRYGGGGGGGGAEGCSSGGGGGGGSSWASSALTNVRYAPGASANTDGSVTITAWVSIPPENQAPGAPTLVDPDDGATVAFGEPHRFTVNASDPDSEPYTATVTVRGAGTDCDGTVVETFTTHLAPSGMDSSGTPSDPLPVGDYCWSAEATDARGTTGPTSSFASFSVLSNSDSSSSVDDLIVPL